MKKDDDLKAIKELLEIVKHKVDMMEVNRTGQSAALHLMKDQQSVMNAKLDAIIRDLDDVEGQLNDPKTGLKRINKKLDVLWDQTVKLTANTEDVKETTKSQTASLNQSNDNIKRVDKRLRAVEGHAGIVASPELTLFLKED